MNKVVDVILCLDMFCHIVTDFVIHPVVGPTYTTCNYIRRRRCIFLPLLFHHFSFTTFFTNSFQFLLQFTLVLFSSPFQGLLMQSSHRIVCLARLLFFFNCLGFCYLCQFSISHSFHTTGPFQLTHRQLPLKTFLHSILSSSILLSSALLIPSILLILLLFCKYGPSVVSLLLRSSLDYTCMPGNTRDEHLSFKFTWYAFMFHRPFDFPPSVSPAVILTVTKSIYLVDFGTSRAS